MSETTQNLENELSNKIAIGHQLLKKISLLNHIDGISKLQKKIKQEITFLSKVLHQGLKKEHLLCTNLHHFSALVSYILETCRGDCVAVMQYFPMKLPESPEEKEEAVAFGSYVDDGPSRINVDVVTDQGRRWVKVIARNPRALSQLSTGAGKFGQKTVLDQADQFVQCAHQHPVMYQPPQVVFAFSSGIEETLAKLLEARGLVVEGRRIPDSFQHTWEDPKSNLPQAVVPTLKSQTVEHLNLDVSTMVAYVSALTNGRSSFVYQQHLLTQQAEWERARPVKPILDKLFEGKRLFCCESAERDFRTIVNTMGGATEKVRTEALMTQVTVVPDECPPRVQALQLSGKIKRRSQLVFGTGDALKALTVSANEGFVRGARNQGVEFAVFLHESRALTEVKESQAEDLSKDKEHEM